MVRWAEHVTRMDNKELACKEVDCIHLVQDRSRLSGLANAIMTLGFYKRRIIS
jgi:hypothetical protein